MKPTQKAWAFFFTGYIALLITDRFIGVSFGVFRAVVYCLMVPAIYLLYKGAEGKGGAGLRVLLTVTHFWLGYALAALIALLFSFITG